MAQSAASRQFSFRLPEALVEQIEQCTATIRAKGLDVSRADVVRLLLNHSLAATKCRIGVLLNMDGNKSARRRRE